MKALIRNKGETVREVDNIAGIDWKSGAPLTSPGWVGGPYTLVEDYVEPEDPEDEPVSRSEGFPPWEHPLETKEEEPVEDVVVINGKTYTKEELRSILGN